MAILTPSHTVKEIYPEQNIYLSKGERGEEYKNFIQISEFVHNKRPNATVHHFETIFPIPTL